MMSPCSRMQSSRPEIIWILWNNEGFLRICDSVNNGPKRSWRASSLSPLLSRDSISAIWRSRTLFALMPNVDWRHLKSFQPSKKTLRIDCDCKIAKTGVKTDTGRINASITKVVVARDKGIVAKVMMESFPSCFPRLCPSQWTTTASHCSSPNWVIDDAASHKSGNGFGGVCCGFFLFFNDSRSLVSSAENVCHTLGIAVIDGVCEPKTRHTPWAFLKTSFLCHTADGSTASLFSYTIPVTHLGRSERAQRS